METLDFEADQNYAIDVYTNPACDPTFFGEGQTYLELVERHHQREWTCEL